MAVPWFDIYLSWFVVLKKEQREQGERRKINSNLTKEVTNMKTNKILCILFVLAAFCFLAGTVNHIVNTHEGWLSSLLLAGACLCGAIVFYRKK